MLLPFIRPHSVHQKEPLSTFLAHFDVYWTL